METLTIKYLKKKKISTTNNTKTFSSIIRCFSGKILTQIPPLQRNDQLAATLKELQDQLVASQRLADNNALEVARLTQAKCSSCTKRRLQF